ncbi:Do family serine endopeptidase [Rhizobium sp. NRK18]|uniref:Do family serine endopeptidase n=1 Tax=Rhizobium sp. NRK18 TaxID=2964667 RepID=UPI0021C3F483|nr:Do family serine endopeptidase [Rhizobium sp. NRK18]MCQ2004868.1 Do family serine endopeptidase [Rhizobium sp. NRK18]
MLSTQNGRTTLKTVLKSTTVAGLAAVLLSTGIPALVEQSYAAPVEVDAPHVASFADVVDAVSPAVVSVRVESKIQPAADDGGFYFNFGERGFDNLPDDHPLKRFFRDFGGPNGGPNGGPQDGGPMPKGKPHLRPTAQGSGFFISDDGYIVTNNHVVADGSAFTVVMNDGTEMPAKLIGTDPRTDLAVLKVDSKRKFTYVQFADDNKVRVGDWVVAVGNPFGLGGTVTAGIVSARGRDIHSGPYDDFIQIDAAVNPGNSGGPAFNLNGEVIGINTAISTPSGGNVGIAFAIPASVAQGVVNDLIKSGTVDRGWLGVQIQPVTKDIAESLGLAEAKGALVIEPQENSPGMEAGIKKGDVVTAVNGDPIKDSRDLARRIGAMAPGAKVDVTIWRDGKSQDLSVKLGTLPAEKVASADQGSSDQATPSTDKALADLGLSVAPSDDGNGVTINDVDPNSDAADKGIRAGDKITSVNNQEISSADDIVKALKEAKDNGRTKALFQIETQQGSRFVALPVSQG